MAAISPHLPARSGLAQAPLAAAGGSGCAGSDHTRGRGGGRDRRALTWEEAAARETGPGRALAMAARRRKGRGGASATPSSRHPSTRRAAIGPGRRGGGRPMGSRGLSCRTNGRRADSGACAERGYQARPRGGWRRCAGCRPKHKAAATSFSSSGWFFFSPKLRHPRGPGDATRRAVPCPGGVDVASREAQAPPLRKSSPQEGGSGLSCSGEARG